MITVEELSKIILMSPEHISELMKTPEFLKVTKLVKNDKLLEVKKEDFLRVIKTDKIMEANGLATSMGIYKNNEEFMSTFSEGAFRSQLSRYARLKKVPYIDISVKENSLAKDRIYYVEKTTAYIKEKIKADKAMSKIITEKTTKVTKTEEMDKLKTLLKESNTYNKTTFDMVFDLLKKQAKAIEDLRATIESKNDFTLSANSTVADDAVPEESRHIDYKALALDLLILRAAGQRNPKSGWDSVDQDLLRKMKVTIQECEETKKDFNLKISLKQKNSLYAIAKAYGVSSFKYVENVVQSN